MNKIDAVALLEKTLTEKARHFATKTAIESAIEKLSKALETSTAGLDKATADVAAARGRIIEKGIDDIELLESVALERIEGLVSAGLLDFSAGNGVDELTAAAPAHKAHAATTRRRRSAPRIDDKEAAPAPSAPVASAPVAEVESAPVQDEPAALSSAEGGVADTPSGPGPDVSAGEAETADAVSATESVQTSLDAEDAPQHESLDLAEGEVRTLADLEEEDLVAPAESPVGTASSEPVKVQDHVVTEAGKEGIEQSDAPVVFAGRSFSSFRRGAAAA